MRSSLFALVSILASGLHGQEATLLEDLNTRALGPLDSNSQPSGFTEFDGGIFFSAKVGGGWRELLVYDGERARQLTDFNFDPYSMFEVGGRLLVFGDSPGIGFSMLRVDSVDVRPEFVIDFDPNRPTGAIVDFAVSGGIGYMAIQVADFGQELWATDGTAAGTSLVFDARPGVTSGAVNDLVPLSGGVLFSAEVQSFVSGLFLWDAGAGRANLLRSFQSVGDLCVDGSGTAYFIARDSVSGTELWRTDGTPAGTTLVRDLVPGVGGNISGLKCWQGQLYFRHDDGVTGMEPWTSDGTAPGTIQIADLEPGFRGSNPTFYPGGDRIWLGASTPATGYEIFSLRGPTSGVVLEHESVSGPSSRLPLLLSAGSDWALFNQGGDLWLAGSGARRVLGQGRARVGVEFGRWVYVGGTDGRSGDEPWRVALDAEGQQLLADLNPVPAIATRDSSPRRLSAVGSSIAFDATSASGSSSYLFDGVTVRLNDVTSTSLPIFSSEHPIVGDRWVLPDHAQGRLVFTDGTPASSTYVAVPQGWNVYLTTATPFEDGVAVPVDVGGRFELWLVNPNGWTRLGGLPGQPSAMLANSQFVFCLFPLPADFAMWVASRNDAPRLLSSPVLSDDRWERFGEKILFQLRKPATPSAPIRVYLMETDGTRVGTRIVNLESGLVPSVLATVGSRVFFTGYNGADRALWVVDERLSAPIRLSGEGVPISAVDEESLQPGLGGVFLQSNISSAAGLYFSDGTPDGLNLVSPTLATVFLDASGSRAWLDVVGQLTEVAFGGESRLIDGGSWDPREGVVSGNGFYFPGRDLAYGREMRRLPIGASVRRAVGQCGRPVDLFCEDPFLGSRTELRGSAPGGAVTTVWLAAGPSSASWQGGSCWWYLDPSRSIPIVAPTAGANWSLSVVVPMDPALVGAEFWLQQRSDAPGAVTFSDALQLTLGPR